MAFDGGDSRRGNRRRRFFFLAGVSKKIFILFSIFEATQRRTLLLLVRLRQLLRSPRDVPTRARSVHGDVSVDF